MVCKVIVCERWCVKAEEAEVEEARDTKSKTRTPHKVVGNQESTKDES